MADNDSFSIIDSHIHLYPATHIPRLNWTAGLPNDHILNRQSSVDEYKAATRQSANFVGFVFLETDRKNSLEDESGWTDTLEEVAYLARIAQGRPIPGEGHSAEDRSLVLGIVPWAPIPAGPEALQKYIAKVRKTCGDENTLRLIKGFRYLLQDKPQGTMLHTEFVSGMKWLGENDFVFDLGVDLRSGGIWQLQEACSMLDMVYGSGNDLKVVINHFCKPNLQLNPDEVVSHHDYKEWAECVLHFAGYPNTFMKMSAFFSELPDQSEHGTTPVSELVLRVKPWVHVVFSAFGPSRIMFGSDWPVCQAGGPGTQSWQHWYALVIAILDDLELSDEEKGEVWSGTAKRAYNINA